MKKPQTQKSVEKRDAPLLIKNSKDSEYSSSDPEEEEIPFIRISPMKVQMQRSENNSEVKQKGEGDDSQNHSAHILAKIFSKNYSVERKGKNRIIFKDNHQGQGEIRTSVPTTQNTAKIDLSNQTETGKFCGICG